MPARWIQPLRHASLRQNPSSRQVLLGLDWDDTLTVGDTIGALKHVCRARDKRLSIDRPSSHLDNIWNNLVDAYLADRAEHKSRCSPPAPVDITSYTTWLRSLGPVERRSIARVGSSGVFAGVRREDVVAGAHEAVRTGDVRLRRGWEELFARRGLDGPNGGSVAWTSRIVSVNWSATFIRQCLLAAFVAQSHPDEESIARDPLYKYLEHELVIDAGEIDGLDEPEGSTGTIIGNVHDSADKLAIWKAAIDTHPAATSVYVGDSSTDFECLAFADVGVWLHDAPETSLVEAFGKNFAPLSDDTDPPDDVCLTWAPDLSVITNWR